MYKYILYFVKMPCVLIKIALKFTLLPILIHRDPHVPHHAGNQQTALTMAGILPRCVPHTS